MKEGSAAVPITVRQLEALVRLSESLAKLEVGLLLRRCFTVLIALCTSSPT